MTAPGRYCLSASLGKALLALLATASAVIAPLSPAGRTAFAAGPIPAQSAASPEASAASPENPNGPMDMPGMVHDHGSKHGGQVGMAGSRHLEALALPEGLLRVYLTNFMRSPVSLDGVEGEAFLVESDGEKRFPMKRVHTPTGEALEARTAPFATKDVDVRFELETPREPISMGFVLPVAWAWLGDRVLPERVNAKSSDPEALRYTLKFSRPVTALASDGRERFFVAAFDMIVSGWEASGGARVRNFLPPGPAAVFAEEDGHNHSHQAAMLAHAPGLLALNDSKGLLASGHVAQVAVHGVNDAALRSTWPLPLAVPWALEFLDRDRKLLVVHAQDQAAYLFHVADGSLALKVTTPGLVRTARADAKDETLAIAVGNGSILLADARTGETLATLKAGDRAVRSLAFLDELMFAGAEDGVLSVWDLAAAPPGPEPLARQAGLSPINVIAVHPDQKVVAVAGFDGKVRLFSPDGLQRLGELILHEELVTGLAWAGDLLISADANGLLAVWELKLP